MCRGNCIFFKKNKKNNNLMLWNSNKKACHTVSLQWAWPGLALDCLYYYPSPSLQERPLTDWFPSRTMSPSTGGEWSPWRHDMACKSTAGTRSVHLFPTSYTIRILTWSLSPGVWLSLWLTRLVYSPAATDNDTINTVREVIQQQQGELDRKI